MQSLPTIERFLQEWDPLNVNHDLIESGQAPTEYDLYAQRILDSLMAGADEAALVSLLAKIQTESLRSVPIPDNDKRIAKALHAWWLRQGSNERAPCGG